MDETNRPPPRTEYENNILTDDALTWCQNHYGTDDPSADTLVEAVVVVLFGARNYGASIQASEGATSEIKAAEIRSTLVPSWAPRKCDRCERAIAGRPISTTLCNAHASERLRDLADGVG